jgi:hypothetical protein
LANHGYIPRDGKNITLDILKDGMLTGFNIENLDAVILFTQAIKTSPKYPNTRSFDLADLGRHNILEHDISLRYIIAILLFQQVLIIAVVPTHSLPIRTLSMRPSGPSPSHISPTI